jgi:hypothetical protein
MGPNFPAGQLASPSIINGRTVGHYEQRLFDPDPFDFSRSAVLCRPSLPISAVHQINK